MHSLKKTSNPVWKMLALPWLDPLALASRIPDEETHWTLLHGGCQHEGLGRYSILAFGPEETIEGSSFSLLAKKLSANQGMFSNAWFGYLGYGLKNTLEQLPQDKKWVIDLPDIFFLTYSNIVIFDNEKKAVQAHVKDGNTLLSDILERKEKQPSGAPSSGDLTLSSNMTKAAYLNKVRLIKEAIRRGDLCQANLTRKFFGNFNNNVEPFELFKKLNEISPAPYSSFMRIKNSYILSSSPEQFIHVDEEGNAESHPIKGSAPRFDDPEKDRASRAALEHSIKDKAENLMIVDLMRNDFSRSGVYGSVRVDDLFKVTGYNTVYHMASTIRAKKHPSVSSLELVRRCFPPGSMTGAPKIRAMTLCSELEQDARGVYSGALGYFGGDGSANLSVVIRTLILQGNHFEFQVGGAITYDSDPEKEWEETLFKARGIADMLGIGMEQLQKL